MPFVGLFLQKGSSASTQKKEALLSTDQQGFISTGLRIQGNVASLTIQNIS